MEISCSLKEIIGGTCGYDRKDRTQSTVVIPLQACNKEIVAHKSTFEFSGIESEVELILSQAGIFISPENIHCWTICPLHRSKLGLGWSRGNNARCRVPAALSSHRQANRKWPKCDRGINKDDSRLILKMTGIFLQVGSGIHSTCRKKLRALVLTSPHKAESVIDQMDALTLNKNIDDELEITFSPDMTTPVCERTTFDVGSTGMSLYKPGETSFTSTISEDISTTLSTPRENLNAFLTSRDVSPIRYTLSAPFEEVSDRTKRFHMRKARQVVTACLEEIVPGQSSTLLKELACDKLGSDKNIDTFLLDALTECYNNTSHWSTRRQILSIMVDKVTFEELQKWIPTLTRYRFNIAKHHLLLHGRGAELPHLKNTRVYIQPEKIDHFVTFITSSHIIQDLPFGEKTLKLSTHREIKIPNVVRNLIPEQCIQQYEGYCKEVSFQPMSRSTLRRVLKVCSASARTSLQGLDYISAMGGQVFDDLENVVDMLGDRYGKGLAWAKQTNQKLKDAKRYLKGDYKIHISSNSEVAHHCRTYALSFPNNENYTTSCDHEHKGKCDRCSIFPETLADICASLEEVNCPLEEKENMEYVTTQAAQHIRSWKAHILRSINQDAARHDILKVLDSHSALIVLDWAMKLIPRKYRESQRDWFAKRGLPWHIAVLTKKNDDGDLQVLTFLHLFKSCSQDSGAVVAIIHDVLSQLSTIAPEVHTVYLRQDNAGCYHSALTLLSLPTIERSTGIQIRRIDFSDPQGGKGACDRKAAHIKNHMNKYLNSGNDIENPEQMKAAIESFEGIPGVKVTVCAPPPGVKGMAGEWDGVSLINNIEYRNESMTVWMAYNNGPGKVLPLTNFCRPPTVPKLIHSEETEDTVSFVAVKARQQPKKSREQNNTDPMEDESNDEKVDTYSKLFLCPEQGCIKSFHRYSSLERHLHCDNHTYVLEHETLYDKAMKLYATKLEEGSGKNPIPTESESVELPEPDIGPELQMGWALRTSTKGKRFSDVQKKYLVDVFDAREQTGRKADPGDVSRAMRSTRNSDGS
ncbi:SURP and G-patch domain-containing 1 [Paramuricea clavata]|uniref:SURP and G-patch domain-containing 1 n=1 Tax=Paramuricea clavata TaxID=317549 RepID=A0A7D9DC72_PARCT|nr:SURP and G-patch domain-containing 1 [Paramuricea clavata]